MIYYLIIINLITFALFGLDKLKSKIDAWRISEDVLIGVSALGGALGALAGMLVFHHKTKHIKFQIGIPLFLIIQIIVFRRLV